MIPAPAVQRGPQGTYVYLVNPGHTATMRSIVVGTTEGNDVEVTNGLAVGDTVVTDGQDKLQEGSNVEIRADNGNPTQTGSPPPQSKPTQAGTPVPRGRK
jgi:multidrug efflux system membrane fusion protein